MNWLPWGIIPKRQWPKVRYKEKRAITLEEHEKIVAREGNAERRALSFVARASFTHRDLAVQTSKSLNVRAQGRVNLIRPEVGQFDSTGDTYPTCIPQPARP
jgi:hypothetical protein